MRAARDNVFLIIRIYASLLFRKIQSPAKTRRERQGSRPAMNAALQSPSSSVAGASARDRELRSIRMSRWSRRGGPMRRSGARRRSRASACARSSQGLRGGREETKLVHARVQSPGSSRRCGSRRAASPTASSPPSTAVAGARPARPIRGVDVAEAAADEGGRKRLLTKLNAMAETIKRRQRAARRRRAGRSRLADAEAALDAPTSLDS